MLFGLGHHDPLEARNCGSKSVRLWGDSVNQDLEHPRTKVFLGNDTLRTELIELSLSEKPLEGYPVLELEITKLALSAVVEISIESKHALAKARIASAGHNISHAYFSLALQQTEIEKFVDKGVPQMEEMARRFSEGNNLTRFCGFGGMQCHPAIANDFMRIGSSSRKVMQRVFTMYEEALKDWKRKREKKRDQISEAKRKRWKTKVLTAPLVQPPTTNDDDDLMTLALIANVDTRGRCLSSIATTTPQSVWDAAVRFVQSCQNKTPTKTVFSVAMVGEMSFTSLHARSGPGHDQMDVTQALFGGGCEDDDNPTIGVVEASRGDPLSSASALTVCFRHRCNNPKSEATERVAGRPRN